MADDSLLTYQPVDFCAGLGYPAMAKLGLAAIVLLLAGVAVLVWFIVRRVRRRRGHLLRSADSAILKA